MAGGGHIIIRRALRAVAELEQVQDSLIPADKTRLQVILVKDEADWTSRDERFVLHCIGNGLAECS